MGARPPAQAVVALEGCRRPPSLRVGRLTRPAGGVDASAADTRVLVAAGARSSRYESRGLVGREGAGTGFCVDGRVLNRWLTCGLPSRRFGDDVVRGAAPMHEPPLEPVGLAMARSWHRRLQPGSTDRSRSSARRVRGDRDPSACAGPGAGSRAGSSFESIPTSARGGVTPVDASSPTRNSATEMTGAWGIRRCVGLKLEQQWSARLAQRFRAVAGWPGGTWDAGLLGATRWLG